MKAMFSFEKDLLLHSGRLVVPMLLLVAYIGIAYAIAPLNILSSFSIGALVVFVLSLSVGVMSAGLSCPMIEQSIYVKLLNKLPYFFSRALLMAAIAAAFGLVSVAGPLLINFGTGGTLFKRPVTTTDALSGLVMFWLASYSGCMAGLFTSPRLIRGRRTSILLSAAFGVLTMVKGALVSKAAFLAYILWILPPVHDLTVHYSAESVLSFDVMWPYFLWMLLYAAAQTVLYVSLMSRRRFE